jgi:redox-sensing transcriptional repressor
MGMKSVSSQAMQRLPQYLAYLKSLPQNGAPHISATGIAEALGMNDVQVRKDLGLVSGNGRPKIGYIRTTLIRDIERFLGYDDADTAVIAGVGSLGRALLTYSGFSQYGLDIVAAFDTDKRLIGTEIHGKEVLSADKMTTLCTRMNIRIGIITVPAMQAQAVCDMLVQGGVAAIWNFAPIHLAAPSDVLVKSENMAGSLALLSQHLKENWATTKQSAKERL